MSTSTLDVHTGRNALAKDVVVDVHVLVDVDGFGRIRLRSGHFEGLAPGKSLALPDRYSDFRSLTSVSGTGPYPIRARRMAFCA